MSQDIWVKHSSEWHFQMTIVFNERKKKLLWRVSPFVNSLLHAAIKCAPETMFFEIVFKHEALSGAFRVLTIFFFAKIS